LLNVTDSINFSVRLRQFYRYKVSGRSRAKGKGCIVYREREREREREKNTNIWVGTLQTERHPHTNMAKAALNMLTRTSAEDLAKTHRIFMNSVDTGWINVRAFFFVLALSDDAAVDII
jgi:NAD(P)-dependent dehydrogenase (short-subunit alcohol dehydrogenase family)